MWHDMFAFDIPATEKIIRTIAVYLGLAILVRLAGKRDLAQLNSFDLVVVLLLSNVVQNAVIGPDDSLTGGLLGAAVLVGFNALVVRASITSDRLNRMLEGTRTVLAEHGTWNDTALRRLGLRRGDVDASLRRQNATSISQAQEVALEPGGALVVTLEPDDEPLTLKDLRDLRSSLGTAGGERLDAIEAKVDAILARLGTS